MLKTRPTYYLAPDSGAGSGDNPPAADPKNDNPGGTAPTKTDAGNDDFDPSKLSDEQLAKIYDDPRLYKHERFKQLNEAAKEAKKLREAQAKAEEEKLKEQQKWQELAEKREAELTEARTQNQKLAVDNKLSAALAGAGAVDVDAALKLIDRSTIKVGDDGTVSGVDEAINGLKESKQYLFTKQSVTVGSPSNPAPTGPTATKTFKRSDLQDSKFYKENRDDILAAMRAGTIIDDVTPNNAPR